MAEHNIKDNGLLLITDTKVVDGQNITESRVYIPSADINVFPCSRRGQYDTVAPARVYDPEARLNTERTNRLHTAINGYKDSFIIENTGDAFVFVLAGYYFEIKNFSPTNIAGALGLSDDDKIYAHLSLHNNVSLNFAGYFTEILYRQSTSSEDPNSLDVKYTEGNKAADFFVGVSFTGDGAIEDKYNNVALVSCNLPLFYKPDTEWLPVQTSLLPKIEHDESEDSIKITGDFTVGGEAKLNDTLEVVGKITANNDLEVKGTTITPVLKTNTITSDNTEVVVDKALKVDTINSDSTNGLTIKCAAKLEKTLTVDGNTTVNDTITAEKLVVTKMVEETDENTGETIRVDKGEVVTPTLRVNRLTTNSGSITVDDKNLVVTKNLEVLAAKAIDEEDRDTAATATIDKAIIGQLEVKADSTKLTGSTGKVKTDGDLNVGSYINVGSPAIPTTTTGDVVAKNSIFAENNIVAKNTIKAPALYQTVNSVDKPVPFIDLLEKSDGKWQLQISRISKKEINNGGVEFDEW